MVDVILITETGAPIAPVSYYCADQKYNLIIVDASKLGEGISLRSSELSDRTTVTLLRPSPLKTVSSSICKALGHCNSRWILLIDDATFGRIRHLSTIRKIAETIPRVASIRQTNTPGIHPTQYNHLMGTLYSAQVLSESHAFPLMITDMSVVAYTWATSVTEKGFVHVTAYVEDTEDSPAIVSPRGVEDHLLEEKTRDSLVIPQLGSLKGWMGSVKKRPWHYRATVVIPHFGTDFRLLMNVIESWRIQSECPYILLYDTGTPPEYHAELRALASYDTEVHFCRWHGVRNVYDPVALAYNHGITDCRTKHVIFTHNDLVPISRHLVGDLIHLSNDDVPVIGYECYASPSFVGTQLTIVYTPVLDRIRARWETAVSTTYMEEGFNHCLKQAGIAPRLIGKEKRGRARTPHFDHVGGLVTARLYSKDENELARVKSDLDTVLGETERRLQGWRGMHNGG